MWHHHFGRGLVETPNDLGKMGGRPSHAELLDWLAIWFRDEARGSMKQLHRLIVTSATYRQASVAANVSSRLTSAHRPESGKEDGRGLTNPATLDPGNRLPSR